MIFEPKKHRTNHSFSHWRALLLFVFLILFQSTLTAQWVCDCEERVPITIEGNTEELNNYQVKLDIPAFAAINSSFSNILFTTDDKVTQLDHWTQAFNAMTGTVWVEIPTILVGGTTIYMYFGNCGSEGDPDNVFDYFNDFDSATGAVQIGDGGVESGTAGTGESVLIKNDDCDPDGAWFPLGFTIQDYVLVTRETRNDDDQTDCAQNRYGIENSDFDGYSIRRNGEAGSEFGFERRANGGGGNNMITPLSPNIPRDTFVISELRRCKTDDINEAELFDNQGNSLASVTGTIAGHNYCDFDRIAIRGGRDYQVDYMGVAKFSCDPPMATFGTPEMDPPEAICMDITVSLDAAGQITILDDATDDGSSDNCDMDLEFELSETMFDCGDLGDNLVTMTITDDEGNTDESNATVTIVDDIPSTITCPADITVDTDPSSCEASSVMLG